MARATVNTVRRMVYENLGITTNGSYGTLLTNERYPTGYIDDRIVEADIDVLLFLLKNKQHTLLKDGATVSSSLATGATVPNNWAIIDVTINGETGVEVSYGVYEQLTAGGIYDTSTYKGYYTLRDGKIYYIGASTSAVITYYDITFQTTLSALLSPTGFEGAIANLASSLLLMKRGDKPEQAAFYKGLFMEFMQGFMIPDSNEQDKVTD